MTKYKLTEQEALHLAAQLVSEHRRLFHENHIMRDALQQLAEYRHDCDHDVIAARALQETQP